MDRKEAMEFLELPEVASSQEIKARLEAKLVYFENLSENAPSDFVRRLHARNVAKVREIMLLSSYWPPISVPVEVEEPGAAAEVVEALKEPEVAQVGDGRDAAVVASAEVVSAGAGEAAASAGEDAVDVEEDEVVEDVEEEARVAERVRVHVAERVEADELPVEAAVDANEPLGWLIRHTENQTPETFPIYVGANFIGRKEQPDLANVIIIGEDPYISKVHAVIFAGPEGFFVADNTSSNGGKASTNGTYINGEDTRISTKTKLYENDTIQVGVTKLMLRYNDRRLSELVDDVAGKDYMHTVVIDI